MNSGSHFPYSEENARLFLARRSCFYKTQRAMQLRKRLNQVKTEVSAPAAS